MGTTIIFLLLFIVTLALIAMLKETENFTEPNCADIIATPFGQSQVTINTPIIDARNSLTAQQQNGEQQDVLPYDPQYTGLFRVANYRYPGKQFFQRSQQLLDKIASECQRNVNTFKGFTDDESDDPRYHPPWSPFGLDAHFKDPAERERIRSQIRVNGNYHQSFTGTLQVDAPPSLNPAYHGPCMWARKGKGNYVPTRVPVPWSGSYSLYSPDACSQNLADRISITRFRLQHKANYNGIDPSSCHDFSNQNYDYEIVPFGVQDNGGVQFAYHSVTPKAKFACITYLDPQFNRTAPDIIVEAESLGGMVAIGNTGTAVLIAQIDNDALSTPKDYETVLKAVVVFWDQGELKWVRRVTDVFRKSKQTEQYVEDPDGYGDYVNHGDFEMNVHMVYDNTSKLIGITYSQTGGRGGHQGCNYYQLDLEGNVVYQTFSCSHCWGVRILPHESGDFPHVCQDDGYGIIRPENKSFGGRIQIERTKIPKLYGAPARLISLARRKNKEGYFIIYGTMQGQFDDSRATLTKYNTFFIQMDNMMNVVKKIPYHKNDTDEIYSCKLMPYKTSNPTDETYLLYYQTMSCCFDANTKAKAEFENLETPLFRSRNLVENNKCPLKNVLKVVRFNGSSFEELSGEFLISVKIPPSSEPHVDSNGDIIWATFPQREPGQPYTDDELKTMLFVKIRNCLSQPL